MIRALAPLVGVAAGILGAAGVVVYVALSGPASPAIAEAWMHLSSTLGDLPAPGRSDEQTAALVLDIDGDGIDDFVIGSRRLAPSLVWYRREAGGWRRHVIDPDLLPLEAGGAFHDIDRDGDPDIVMGEDWTGNRVYWWRNPHPDHGPDTRWPRYVIKDSGANKHHDQIFGDFDGDGEAELVFWNQGARTLVLADIPSSPEETRSWHPVPILETRSEDYEGLARADIDGDGDIDLIGGGRWFEYAGGTTYTEHVIDEATAFSRAAAGQLVEGGRPEVVLVAGDGVGRLKWYQWNGADWLGHDLLGHDVVHGHSLEVADMDGDGHLDILCAEMHTPGAGANARLWLFRGDGRGNFETNVVAEGLGNHESRVADLDGDGDLDILVKPYHHKAPRLDILLNRTSRWDRWRRHVIDAKRPWRSIFVIADDLDRDGHRDIVTGAWWYRNPGAASGEWRRHAIGAPLNNVAAVHDFDGDGDPDVLGTKGRGSEPSAEFVWARNEGGGSFTVFDSIAAGNGDFLQGVAVARFDGENLGVALSWHAAGKGIQLLSVPPEPARESWPLERISDVSQDEALSAGDIDHDGTIDLLLGTKWLRHASAGWKPVVIAPEAMPDRNRLADINGDGLLDAVVGFEAIGVPGEVVWYEQPRSVGAPWRRHRIAEVIGPMSLDVGDLDQDGDLDVTVGEHDTNAPERAKLHVFENTDGRGARWTGHVISRGDEHHDGAILVDIDNDLDLDIVSIGWTHDRVVLFENRMRE